MILITLNSLFRSTINSALTSLVFILLLVILLTELLHWPDIFEPISRRYKCTWVILGWICFVIFRLGIEALRTLTCRRLSGELCIATTFHHGVHAIVATLRIVVMLFCSMLVHCSLVDFTGVSSLVCCLRCSFELIKVCRLLAYLGHLYFVPTSGIWADWKCLLVWGLDICRAWIDWLVVIWLSSLW